MLNVFRKPNFPLLESLIDFELYNNIEIQKLYQSVFHNDSLRNALPEGNNFNYKKYIILATQRTGTTLLTNLLRSHSNLVSYYEIFSGKNDQLSKGFKPFDSDLYKLSIKFPVDFLNHFVFRNYAEKIEAVGFKLMYNQLSETRMKEVFDMNDNSINIIHLKRRNKLKTLVSLRLAEKNNLWSQFKPETVKNLPNKTYLSTKNTGSYAIKTINLTIKECDHFFESITKQEEVFDKIITNNPVLPVFYEDLEVNIENEIKRMISFLNISKEKLTFRTVKQNQQSLPQSIQNYAEIAAYFCKTPWRVYFEE